MPNAPEKRFDPRDSLGFVVGKTVVFLCVGVKSRATTLELPRRIAYFAVKMAYTAEVQTAIGTDSRCSTDPVAARHSITPPVISTHPGHIHLYSWHVLLLLCVIA